jgi:hypothetical protein
MLDVVRGLELGIGSFSFLLIVLFRQGLDACKAEVGRPGPEREKD